MKLRTTCFLAAALVALAGCSDPPESGYVLNKGHEAAYDWVQMICGAYGKYGCTVYVPIVQHEPEHWTLCLVDDKGSKSGTCRNREVDAATWRQYATGQHYPDPR
jgi:hypothetical protein